MTTTGENSSATVHRYDAAGIIDAAGLAVSPGSLLVRRAAGGLSVLAVGSGAEVDRNPHGAQAAVTRLPDSVLIPGLVNAHSHLDLTHVGPVPADPEGGFAAFARIVMGRRHADPDRIAASVRRGIELSLAGGTVAIGDIGGCPRTGPTLVPWQVLRHSPLLGVSYLEFFGIGRTEKAGRERVAALLAGLDSGLSRVRLGLQPHAPYTVASSLYRWAADQAARLGLPLSTHLAETPEERRFVADAVGPMRDLLESLGIWDAAAVGGAGIGRGLHPTRHLADFLKAKPLLAHVNDATDDAIALLAATGSSVVYCPRSSAYFGAEGHFGPHRYRDMLAAGINVCLGTDSSINLPAAAAQESTGGISILDEMRFLHARDGTDPALLLRMATLNGARGLGLPASLFTLSPDSTPAGILAVDVSDTPKQLPPLMRILHSTRWPRFAAPPHRL